MKKIVSMLLALLMLATVAGCTVSTNDPTATDEPQTEAESKTIAFILPYESELFISIIEACSAEWEAAGYTCVRSFYDGDVAKHIEIIENYVSTGVKMIVTNPVGGGVDDAYKAAIDAGVSVFCFGTVMENYSLYISSDENIIGAEMGKAAADYVNNVLKQETGEAVAFTDDVSESAIARSTSMTEAFLEGCPGWTIVAEDTPSETGDATAILENMLQAHPDIQIVLGYGDMFSIEAANVLEASGRTGEKYGVFSTDGQQSALALIASGTSVLRSTQVYDDMLGSLVGAGFQLLNGEVTADSQTIKNLGFTTVTSENIADFYTA